MDTTQSGAQGVSEAPEIEIVVATQKKTPQEFATTSIGLSLTALRQIMTFKPRIFYDNSLGLSTVYNQAVVEELESNSSIESFVFVHDDVEIHDLMFPAKLNHYFEKYRVLGLAGSRKISLKVPIVAWHTNERTYHRGMVVHPYGVAGDQLGDLKYYGNSFGFMNDEVVAIDGLFIAAKREIFEGGVRFNEKFDFDFYDLAFSFNVRAKEFKIGVVPIFCVHNSHGSGIMKPRYAELQKLFIEEYGK